MKPDPELLRSAPSTKIVASTPDPELPELAEFSSEEDAEVLLCSPELEELLPPPEPEELPVLSVPVAPLEPILARKL